MNINLHYEEKGNGEPLIFLHGNRENHEYFKAQTEFFSKYYKIYAIDTRGHGLSPRGEAPFTIEQFADDLYRFMTQQNISKASIVGFSDGGNIAMVFAIKYPELVNRLVLNGANMFPKGMKVSVWIPIVLGYRITTLLSKWSVAARKSAEMLGLMVNHPNLTKRDLKKIKAPTLVVAGKKDMIRQEHTEFIHSCLKDSRLVILNGDHFVANKKPEEFNRVVYEFLDDKKPVIERIIRMEQNLDDVNEVLESMDEAAFNSREIQAKIKELSRYYESGSWLKDYERDERGELPKDLKRGVLAQDELFELFEKIKGREAETSKKGK